MKIITKEIERCFKKQGDTSNKSPEDIKIVVKLFNPVGPGTWYLYEQIDDDTYLGYVYFDNPDYAECGLVSMSELMSLRLPWGLKIERDKFYKPMSKTLKQVMDAIERKKRNIANFITAN